MFTGLVERLATVKKFENNSGRLELDIGVQAYANLGDSVAVNGCCLTVVSNESGCYTFDVNGETMSVTNIGSLAKGDKVNIERAMRLDERLGGHLVSGHVDALGRVMRLEKRDKGWLFVVRLPNHAKKFIIHKGSITVNGVSLTLNRVDDLEDGSVVEMMLIPETIRRTNLIDSDGKLVNIEVDIMAKYLHRWHQIETRELSTIDRYEGL